MALDLLDHVSSLEIPHLPGTKFRIRIGCHTGKYDLSKSSYLPSEPLKFFPDTKCNIYFHNLSLTLTEQKYS